MRWYAITSESGEDLGMFKASSEDEALEMLAIEAGYVSKAEADEAVFVATGRCPEPLVDELTDEEAQARLDRLE